MRFAIAFTVLFAWNTFSRADQPVSYALTPAEIADGWIQLFDGKTAFGWTLEGDARVEKDAIVLGGKGGGKARSSCAFGPAILQVVYAPVDLDDTFKIQFRKDQGMGASSSLAVTASSRPAGIDLQSSQLTALASGNNIPEPVVLSKTGSTVSVKSVKLRPLAMTSLFNGKDLTGWHPYTGPDAKSKFSVTPEGTLHIENGKGDLQTDKQWSNFLLQIECRTNAPALNSGVFFRCQPNKYQQGYEAQIQNSFSPKKDFKEYTIERYDPQTHKLIAKDKVKYDSYDYGTGAIYRRIPARFKAANDKEWFTMTVLAEGRHMGVWVNGIMVTDWTDNRPDNDNGRNGFKAGPGNISLQGHDPTTNLDFRNIRIVDLSKK